MFWAKMTKDQIDRAVFDALSSNLSYCREDVIGFPGSYLDREVFPDAASLRELPYLSCVRENPNHIGCHTLTQAEVAFAGTQRIEVDLIRICAEEIMGAQAAGYDGHVCGGGTECNIEGLWIQRNRARREGLVDVAVIHSEDAHYSIPKACDLLGLAAFAVPVDERTRQMHRGALREVALMAKDRGVKRLFLVLTMGTTLFGSIDDIDAVTQVLDDVRIDYRIHVDAAFGGFIYPFTAAHNRLDFRHPKVDSITMDGHKMLQAPYGTGIFLARKGLVELICTEQARYVHGKDYTLCGSRSGANAVALWMILQSYGSAGGKEFLQDLVERTDKLCEGLDRLGATYFRDPAMNIVAIATSSMPIDVAKHYMLVPDRYDEPRWWKAVVMDHVNEAMIMRFLDDLHRSRGAPPQ